MEQKEKKGMVQDEEEREEICEAVREIRRRVGWSQKDFGKMLGIPRTTIVRYERGYGKPNTARLLAILHLATHLPWEGDDIPKSELIIRRELEKKGINPPMIESLTKAAIDGTPFADCMAASHAEALKWRNS